MRGRHIEAVEELDMHDDEPPGDGGDVRPRSKHGAQRLLPGPSLDITLRVRKKQITQIDWLAAEIRAGAGMWITRSAIVTAVIEAALRTEPHGDFLEASDERSLSARLLKSFTPLQKDDRRVRVAKRVLQMAKYLRRRQKRDLLMAKDHL